MKSDLTNGDWVCGQAAIVVSADLMRARFLQNTIENSCGIPVLVFYELAFVVEAIEDNPGFFSAVFVDDRLPLDSALRCFRQWLEVEDPQITVQKLSLLVGRGSAVTPDNSSI